MGNTTQVSVGTLPPTPKIPSHATGNGQASVPATVLELHEAPYSWNCTTISPEGFNEMFTVRAVSAEGFFARVAQVKSNLLDLNYKPAPTRGASALVAQSGATEGGEVVPVCVIHNKPMTKRSKDGRSWWSCSEKLADGQWCQYRPKQS